MFYQITTVSKMKIFFIIWFEGFYKTHKYYFLYILSSDFFFLQECNELNDEALNRAFLWVKDISSVMMNRKKAFRKLRDGICDIVKSCADNIRVVIYIDEVLDQPNTVVVVEDENRLRITCTIKEDGIVTFFWMKENWGKIFREPWKKVKAYIRRIVRLITKSERIGNFSVEEDKPKAITD